MTTTLIVKELKELDQDFEWYPTTQGMIDVIKSDMMKYFYNWDGPSDAKKMVLARSNVLDCGAGDGRVAEQLANGGQKYVIEKSQRLTEQMPADLFIVGTEFFQSTLIDKKVDVIFCNPPYSEYVQWTEKIILEANAKMIYLIIPQRWQGNKGLTDALKAREATWQIIGSDNFLDAERRARATVDIIAIKLFDSARYQNDRLRTDPFDIWFETNFKLKAEKEKDDRSDYEKRTSGATTLKSKLAGQLTSGRGLVPVLVELYNQEMEHLQNMFLSICELDPDILQELGVSQAGLKEALKQRIVGLKNKYWEELFNNYDKITKRLTHKSRESMLRKLMEHTSIDFTESNIYALSVWVIKNANKYFDTQLIGLVEKIMSEANVTLYKSNERVFTDHDWRYCYRDVSDPPSHFGLDLRIVLHNVGGVKVPDDWGTRYTNDLADSAHKFLDDVITIADNLGFTIPSWNNSLQVTREWSSNKKVEFWGNGMDSKEAMLMTVKGFLNGNLHIKFNQKFIRTLNVEFGRLKGWLTNHIQASEELNIPIKETEKLFKANYQLTQTNGLLQIGYNDNEEQQAA